MNDRMAGTDWVDLKAIGYPWILCRALSTHAHEKIWPDYIFEPYRGSVNMFCKLKISN